ncbi:MAG: OmpA family protein [Rhodobacteraceae bacterium]|nr:OmpA family protein [Paracoccaceae bacterium]
MPVAAAALTLPYPADHAAELTQSPDSYSLPVGPWKAGTLDTITTEGRVTRTAWRVDDATLTTLALLAPLRDQLGAEGYRLLYECATADCGGFDFRFAVDVLPEPEMHVDLGDFRFLSAERRREGGSDYLAILVSRSSDSGFVEIVQIGSAGTAAPGVVSTGAAHPATGDPAPKDESDLARALTGTGKVVLGDLGFATGSSALEAGDYASLEALAAFLKANPEAAVVLVGHTDAVGSLDANIAVSRARAQSVMDRLVSAYGADPRQLSAEGVGYLSPVASNLTAEGRTRNRRVEATLASTR